MKGFWETFRENLKASGAAKVAPVKLAKSAFLIKLLDVLKNSLLYFSVAVTFFTVLFFVVFPAANYDGIKHISYDEMRKYFQWVIQFALAFCLALTAFNVFRTFVDFGRKKLDEIAENSQ